MDGDSPLLALETSDLQQSIRAEDKVFVCLRPTLIEITQMVRVRRSSTREQAHMEELMRERRLMDAQVRTNPDRRSRDEESRDSRMIGHRRLSPDYGHMLREVRETVLAPEERQDTGAEALPGGQVSGPVLVVQPEDRADCCARAHGVEVGQLVAGEGGFVCGFDDGHFTSMANRTAALYDLKFSRRPSLTTVQCER